MTHIILNTSSVKHHISTDEHGVFGTSSVNQAFSRTGNKTPKPEASTKVTSVTFQISDSLAVLPGVSDLASGAFSDISADIDDEDFVGHVDLAFVHVV